MFDHFLSAFEECTAYVRSLVISSDFINTQKQKVLGDLLCNEKKETIEVVGAVADEEDNGPAETFLKEKRMCSVDFPVKYTEICPKKYNILKNALILKLGTFAPNIYVKNMCISHIMHLMTAEQIEVLEACKVPEVNLSIKGRAGSGKSVTAIQFARHVHEQNADAKILYVTYSDQLAKLVR